MSEYTGLEIAVIGLSGRFPGGKTVNDFWKNLTDGVELTVVSSESESKAENSGKPVKAYGVLDNVEMFDASFFGITPREAEAMDPQHRLFLECAWEALENAGYNSETETRPIGVYSGIGASTYLLYNLYQNQDFFKPATALQDLVGVDKDYAPSRVSYKLNLTGPSVSIQTSCSSSLVAVHVACKSLLSGECDMALAAGVAVKVPQNETTLAPVALVSRDGHCRAFDAKANGTIASNGIGVVVLKRLEDAIADRDYIYAVVKGSAINNDGSLKIGYTAPSEEGQAKVIRAAQFMAEVEPETISYMETHGTGTSLGDPIEIAAMTRAFRASTDKKGYCAIGAVKTNVGHSDAAAGITSFIKTVLSIHHQLLPPSLNFETPNPEIDFENSPFYVNTQLTEWNTNGTPRRAGVSSFGFGGTNAHAILEEAPVLEASSPSGGHHLLVLSAKTDTALETATTNLTNYLKQHSQVKLADVAYTLQVGRRAFNHRQMVVANSVEDAINALETVDPQRVLTGIADRKNRPVIFMFSGQGSQYVNMGRQLYETEAIFRQECDRCLEILQSLGLNLQSYLYPGEEEGAALELQQTAMAQPALFVIEYALAKLWMSWGVSPVAAIGHSIGEYVAACLAGVFSLEDALHLVLARGKLMQQCSRGAMLSVGLSAEEIKPFLDETISLAAINAPSMTVVSGAIASLEKLERVLAEKGIKSRRLHTSHAFHSPMMEEIVEPFIQAVKKVKLNPPQLPFISNVTGTWITSEEAIAPAYWAQHLRQPVLFSPGITELLKDGERVFLEVGPGRTLSTFVKQQPGETAVLTSLRHPQDQQSDTAFLLNSLGRLWLAGVKVDWAGFYRDEKRDRLPLPSYPFERQRYWIEPLQTSSNGRVALSSKTFGIDEWKAPPKLPIEDWFYVPSWKRSVLPSVEIANEKPSWLVFADDLKLGTVFSERLQTKHQQEIVQVKIGAEFQKIDDRTYTINPQVREQYDRLIEEIGTATNIAHFWGINSASSFEEAQDLGFYSLLYLVQALGKNEIDTPLEITAVSSNIQVVAGNETPCPEKATILGACNVISQEQPHITCRHIDVVIPEDGIDRETPLIEQLIAETTSHALDKIVAYRGNYRWVEAFEPVPLNPIENQTRLRKNGVYMITGGLGGLGLGIAEYLAENLQAKLALIGRSQIPPKGEWEQLLATRDERDPLAKKIRKLIELEKLGADILLLSADVTDETEMQSAATQIYEKFGKLNGIFHAAGVRGGGLVQLKTPEMAAPIIAPKVKGIQVLDRLFQNTELDFLACWSSITAFTGGYGHVDYAAAHAALDRLASLSSLKTITINWNLWQEAGMAVDAQIDLGFEESHEDALKQGMTLKEGMEAFNRILHSGLSQAIVATQGMEVTLNLYNNLKSVFEGIVKDQNSVQTAHPRPNLGTAYVAPRDRTETMIADLWQSVLGIEKIGIYDDFFDLGGHSLLATQVVSRLEEMFRVEVSLRDLLEGKTIATLSEIVAKMQTEAIEIDKPKLIAVDRAAYRLKGEN